MCKKNVILAEREKDTLLSVSLILKFNGYNVTVCKNLNEGLDEILTLEKASSFCEFIITDIPVSHLTDKDLVDKRSKSNRTFPIFVITDFADEKMHRDYGKKSFYLMEKPIESQDLLKYIHKTLQEGKRRIV